MRLTFARRHRTWRERHHGERQGIARRRHVDTGRGTRAEETRRKGRAGGATNCQLEKPEPADATIRDP
jgi:hypothetical protein